MTYICTCGATVTDIAPGSAADHCELCDTRPTPDLVDGRDSWDFDGGHRFSPTFESDPDETPRCVVCDGRPHSHRVYPDEWSFPVVIEKVERIFRDPNHWKRAA